LLLGALLCERSGPRMHTVFTVCFDDLLLEALLLLRRQARLFGDAQGRERPLLCPQAPQIVHLHGRLGGYLLRHREHLDLEESLYEHLRESSLIVCDYAKADERIMGTIRRWLKGPDMAGHLYWVVHRQER